MGELGNVANQVDEREKLRLDIAFREHELDVLGDRETAVEELGMGIAGHGWMERGVCKTDFRVERQGSVREMDSEPLGCIYLITCIENGKRYVGKTEYPEPDTRYRGHWGAVQRNVDHCPLHHAMRKYGRKQFRVEKLCNTALETIDAMEAYFAEQLETYVWDTPMFHPPGYNANWCGIPGHNVPHSAETKDKLRVLATGRKATDEAKANMSKANKGRKPSAQNRLAVEEAARRPKSDAHKEALRRSNLGQHLTPEQRARQLEAAVAKVGTTVTEAHRANISASLKGKPKSDAHKEALSKAMLGKPASEAMKAARKAEADARFRKLFAEHLQAWIANPSGNTQWKYDMSRKKREGRLLDEYVSKLESTPGWEWSTRSK